MSSGDIVLRWADYGGDSRQYLFQSCDNFYSYLFDDLNGNGLIDSVNELSVHFGDVIWYGDSTLQAAIEAKVTEFNRELGREIEFAKEILANERLREVTNYGCIGASLAAHTREVPDLSFYATDYNGDEHVDVLSLLTSEGASVLIRRPVLPQEDPMVVTCINYDPVKTGVDALLSRVDPLFEGTSQPANPRQVIIDSIRDTGEDLSTMIFSDGTKRIAGGDLALMWVYGMSLAYGEMDCSLFSKNQLLLSTCQHLVEGFGEIVDTIVNWLLFAE